MSIKEPLRVGFVRDDARMSLRSQRAALTAAGVSRIYDDWDMLIRQRRRGHGDVIVVVHLYLIADPTRRTVKGSLRQSVIDRRAEARRAGASILELSTGRSTLTADDADAMLANALGTLAQSRARSERIGRPPREHSERERDVMQRHWTSMRHRTNREAILAMANEGVSVSVQRVTRLFGPSGRKPGLPGGKPKT